MKTKAPAILCLLPLLAACQGSAPPPAPAASGAPPAQGTQAPLDEGARRAIVNAVREGSAPGAPADPHAGLPGMQGGAGMPGGMMGMRSEPRPAVAGPVKVADVVLTPPANWESQPLTSGMRAAQYKVPVGGQGDIEVVVFFFGPGQGGGVEENVERWTSQFSGPGGKPSSGPRREDRMVGGIKVTTVHAAGTYDAGMGSANPQAGFAMHGAIIQSPGGPVFVRATGPEGAVREALPQLESFVTSLAPGT